ncbi:MAG: CDP-diacylglycerol--serine O-phosphatidyltransferase [Deltaproteobacteria bacterium]|nr:CDP-diacylglycerol--serine O-phosphatidyltransferase [Deltaproteobacteria bacterium]
MMAPEFRRKRSLLRIKRPYESREETTIDWQRKTNRINKMKKGIFILPSLLTLTSIFFSFYGLILSLKSQFLWSGVLIIVAAFFDGIDGKVARLTKTSTRFGVELDSLADVISFGVAPSVLFYTWALEPFGRLGWVTAFIYVACGALRLARFNVQSSVIDPKRFNGLPIPAAAGMLSTAVIFFEHLEINPANYSIFLLALVVALSFLMVSSIKFHAFKDLTLVKEKPFSSTVGFVLLMSLIAIAPFIVPFFLCAAYVISGPVMTAIFYFYGKKHHKISVINGSAISQTQNQGSANVNSKL